MEIFKTIRRSGRTTRLADQYIQQLFEFGEVKIKDHTNNRVSNENLFNIVKDRLRYEHERFLDYEIIYHNEDFLIKLKVTNE